MDVKLATLLRRALAHGYEPKSERQPVHRAEASGVGPRVARKADAVVPHHHLYAVSVHGESHFSLGRSCVLDDVVHRLADDPVERFLPFRWLRDVGVRIEPHLEIAE